MDIDVVTVNLRKPKRVTGTIVCYKKDDEEPTSSDEVPVQQCVSSLRAGFGCENSTTKPQRFDDFVALEHGVSKKKA